MMMNDDDEVENVVGYITCGLGCNVENVVGYVT